MAAYLFIDWGKYRDEFQVSPHHAHVALLHLLLMEIIDIQTNLVPNIGFEDKPRAFYFSI